MRYLTHCFAAVMLVAGTAGWGEEIRVPFAPDEPQFTIPAPQGPHAVGVRAFSWIDTSTSAPPKANSMDYREIAVQVWYPAKIEEGDRTALYFPELSEMLSAAESLPASKSLFGPMPCSQTQPPTASNCTGRENGQPGACVRIDLASIQYDRCNTTVRILDVSRLGSGQRG